MHFLYPFFLFAFVLIAIPVIIHLFNFRRFKKIYFSNVRFLKELKQETQKTSKLKHLMVLLSRILAVTCLVIAFAQPYIPSKNQKKAVNTNANAVSIFIDNSFSMENLCDNGKLLDEAKNKAKEIISAYNPSDVFQILTNDFEGKHQRLVSREEFLEMLEEADISPNRKNISEIISRQEDLLHSAATKNKVIYIISDFQKTFSDIRNITNDTTVTIYLIPVKANKISNVFIDSCWFYAPVQQINQNVKLFVRVKNNSDENLEKYPVKLYINKQQKALASLNINAHSKEEALLQYTIRETGIQSGVVEINDYPITYDDKFFFSYNVYNNIKILIINGKGKENVFLNTFFKNDSSFIVQSFSEQNIDYSSFKNHSLIILNEIDNIPSGLSQELKNFITNGGSIMVLPSEKIDIGNYKEFLTSVNSDYYTELDTNETRVEKINLSSSIYSDVFEKIPQAVNLPKVSIHYRIQAQTRSQKEYLLKTEGNEDFLSLNFNGKGKIYLSSVPLDLKFSNFAKHPVFVPTMYKIALLSTYSDKLFYTIGNDEIIELKNVNSTGENIFRIKNIDNDFAIIPEYRNIDAKTCLLVHNQIKEAGNYYVSSGNENITGVSFNYDRKESDMEYYKADELMGLAEKSRFSNIYVVEPKNRPMEKLLNELNQGVKLWKLFIILALVFLGAEIALLKFVK